MFKFLKSRHRKLYWRLGLKYNVWPEHVYKLAHGKRSRKQKDTKILHELLSQGIIHRHTSNSTPDDSKVVFAK